MGEVEFLGARLDREVIGMVEKTAKEEQPDKTRALRELIILGRQQLLLRKYLYLYRRGGCSIDKAALAVGITINEMMAEAAKEDIRSTETLDEYRRGLQLL